MSLLVKTYTGWGFWRSVFHIEGLSIWLFYYRKLASLVYPISTQEHTIQLCVKILQIESELFWFRIVLFMYFLCGSRFPASVWRVSGCVIIDTGYVLIMWTSRKYCFHYRFPIMRAASCPKIYLILTHHQKITSRLYIIDYGR